MTAPAYWTKAKREDLVHDLDALVADGYTDEETPLVNLRPKDLRLILATVDALEKALWGQLEKHPIRTSTCNIGCLDALNLLAALEAKL